MIQLLKNILRLQIITNGSIKPCFNTFIYYQALVPIPVPLDPIPNPLTLKSDGTGPSQFYFKWIF